MNQHPKKEVGTLVNGSSFEQQRYLRQQTTRTDKNQARFTTEGTCLLPPSPLPLHTLNLNLTVTCPFCLHQAKLRQFLISTKKGISTARALCRNCNNTMNMNSLTNEMTIEEYARWCFNYSLSGFWQKVPFTRWSTRLREFGWAREFWDNYKRFKGETEERYQVDTGKEWDRYENEHVGE